MNWKDYFDSKGYCFGMRTDLFLQGILFYLNEEFQSKVDVEIDSFVNLDSKKNKDSHYFDIYEFEDYHVGDKMKNPFVASNEIISKCKQYHNNIQNIQIGINAHCIVLIVNQFKLKRKNFNDDLNSNFKKSNVLYEMQE